MSKSTTKPQAITIPLTDAELAAIRQRYNRPIVLEGDVGKCLARWRQAETDVRRLLAEVIRSRQEQKE